MNTNKRRTSALAVLATTAALGIGTLGAVPASANPGPDPTQPGSNAGAGVVGITGATTVAEGQKISFAGSGFVGSAGAFQSLFVKIDAFGPGTSPYNGTAVDPVLGDAIIKQAQVQADGTVSGSIVVPADIDDEAVNPDFFDSDHFLRILGGAPGTSKYTQDFTVDAGAPPAPEVTATSAYAGRGGTFTITVNATGFAANEPVTIARATGWNTSTPLTWATVGGVQGGTTDASGGLVNTTVTPASGTIAAGEHQLILTGATSGKVATAQLTVAPRITVAGLAQGSAGTLTLTNTPVGTEISAVRIDNDGDLATTADQVAITSAPIAVTDAATTTAAVQVPASQPTGYGKKIVVSQTKPYVATYELTSKVSPSAAPLNASGYDRVETADGAIRDGLYQSAYSAASDAVFATSAFSTTATPADPTQGWDGRLYKLDADTLAVLDEERPGFVAGSAGARYAPYGVGVDDVNGTVWVTNTRQNTVAVYDQDTLDLLVQHTQDVTTGGVTTPGTGTVGHSRDAIYDPTSNRVFVSSASEGATGNGYIAVFEAGDNDGDGTPYEKIQNVAEMPRSEFSPMSLEVDAASGKIYSVSLQTSRAIEIDTTTLTHRLIELPGLEDIGTRGASGVAFDPVSDRLFIVAQDNDVLLITDLDGTTLHEVPIGAGALNVAFDPVKRLVYVANFGGTTVSVTDIDGKLVANLPFVRPNHVVEDGKGSVYAVNKDSGNKVIKLTPKAPVTPVDPSTTPQCKTAKAQAAVAQANVAVKQAKVAKAKKQLKKAKKAKKSPKKVKKVKKMKAKVKKAKKAVAAATGVANAAKAKAASSCK